MLTRLSDFGVSLSAYQTAFQLEEIVSSSTLVRTILWSASKVNPFSVSRCLNYLLATMFYNLLHSIVTCNFIQISFGQQAPKGLNSPSSEAITQEKQWVVDFPAAKLTYSVAILVSIHKFHLLTYMYMISLLTYMYIHDFLTTSSLLFPHYSLSCNMSDTWYPPSMVHAEDCTLSTSIACICTTVPCVHE